MRIVFLGSGAFAVPTLEHLLERHDVALAVSQPDRPAGRGRRSVPTPVAQRIEATGLPLLRPEDPNADPDVAEAIAAAAPDALVVIAYGHKLGPALLGGRFAINLHGSLLPRHRGAAPVNWAILCGDACSGVSVITLAARMDAGLILAQREIEIDPRETAGELHDRLALLGPAAVQEVLDGHAAGTLDGREQDPAQVTWAPRLSKADGTVDFAQPAGRVRCRVHGLTPWPGCAVELAGRPLRLQRVEEVAGDRAAAPGALIDGDLVACRGGAVRLLEVQPPGGRVMTFDDYRRGRALPKGARLEPAGPSTSAPTT